MSLVSVFSVSSHRAGSFGGTTQWLRSALKQKNHQRSPKRLKLQVRPSEKGFILLLLLITLV